MHQDIRREAAPSRLYRRARRFIGAAALLVLGGVGAGACKSSDEPPVLLPPPVQAGPFDACTVDADCGFGEIQIEIGDDDDCPCLYGCPFLPLTKATIERRQSQYEAVCDPREDGNGETCGIDDCTPAPTPACVAGKCTAASD
jgi:hypothetical protein